MATIGKPTLAAKAALDLSKVTVISINDQDLTRLTDFASKGSSPDWKAIAKNNGPKSLNTIFQQLMSKYSPTDEPAVLELFNSNLVLAVTCTIAVMGGKIPKTALEFDRVARAISNVDPKIAIQEATNLAFAMGAKEEVAQTVVASRMSGYAPSAQHAFKTVVAWLVFEKNLNMNFRTRLQKYAATKLNIPDVADMWWWSTLKAYSNVHLMAELGASMKEATYVNMIMLADTVKDGVTMKDKKQLAENKAKKEHCLSTLMAAQSQTDRRAKFQELVAANTAV